MSDELEMVVTNNNLPLLVQLEAELKKRIHVAMRKIGQTIADAAVMHIGLQDLPWEPLTLPWVAHKFRKSYSTHTYIMTATYIQNITWQYHMADYKVEIGVMKSVIHYDKYTGKMDYMWRIAEALEFGDTKHSLPPRPLWQPTLEEHRRSVQTRIGIAIQQGFKDIAAKAKGTP